MQASALAAAKLAAWPQGLGKMGEMEKWREWGGNGGGSRKKGNCKEIAKSTFWKMYKKCVKLKGNRRKIGEK